MRPALIRFLLRRIVRAFLLVFAVSSAAMSLVHLAPGDAFSSFELDAATARVERARLGLDRPFVVQYAGWLRRVARLDFGESTRFNRPVAALLGERAGATILLGLTALVLAVGAGVPAGVVTGSARRRWPPALLGALSGLLLATPPLILALVLLLLASGTAFRAGVLLPALALALPIAAALERLQSRAMTAVLADPSIVAARARGIPRDRLVWRHALRLSLASVLGVLGIVIGSVLSGSFIVEIVMSWPGLGDLTYQALVARDVNLAAGCAVAASTFLAAGVLAADIGLLLADPRTMEAM